MSFKFVIEKGIPIPVPPNQAPEMQPLRIALRSMAVGDSMFVPDPPFKRGYIESRTTAEKHSGNRPQFTCRKTDRGFRVWRIK